MTTVERVENGKMEKEADLAFSKSVRDRDEPIFCRGDVDSEIYLSRDSTRPHGFGARLGVA